MTGMKNTTADATHISIVYENPLKKSRTITFVVNETFFDFQTLRFLAFIFVCSIHNNMKLDLI